MRIFAAERGPSKIGAHAACGSARIFLAEGEKNGGGGNRTRVREPLRKSLYKLRLPLNFARRPVDSRPTAGLAILWCRTSGDWLSVGAEPVF